MYHVYDGVHALSIPRNDSCVAAFEVNFMDDVGQTLLNWASAFGTQEMVRC